MEITELKELINKNYRFDADNGGTLDRQSVIEMMFDGKEVRGNRGKIDLIFKSMGIKKTKIGGIYFYTHIGFSRIEPMYHVPTVDEIITNTDIHEPAEKISVSRLDEIVGITEWKTPCEEEKLITPKKGNKLLSWFRNRGK